MHSIIFNYSNCPRKSEFYLNLNSFFFLSTTGTIIGTETHRTTEGSSSTLSRGGTIPRAGVKIEGDPGISTTPITTTIIIIIVVIIITIMVNLDKKIISTHIVHSSPLPAFLVQLINLINREDILIQLKLWEIFLLEHFQRVLGSVRSELPSRTGESYRVIESYHMMWRTMRIVDGEACKRKGTRNREDKTWR